MRYTLTLSEKHEAQLREELFSQSGVEGAAFLLCGRSVTPSEERLLSHEVIAIAPEHYLARLADFLSLDSLSYTRVAKRARERNLAVILAHSHPFGPSGFSLQDDKEDVKLHEFLASRVPGRTHGSLVLTPDAIVGRVWQAGLIDMERVRVVGKRWRFHVQGSDVPAPAWFDRQVRAFGADQQALLSRLRVGVVGLGGTGSAVAELLVRLGVGELLLVDDDVVSESNVTRVFGSGMSDAGKAKVQVAFENAARIGMGARIEAVQSSINKEETARRLRDCDVVFGCTDKERPRAALQELVTHYLIPLIDVGVKIGSREGAVTDVVGRVSTLGPGEACLLCRGRITPEGIRNELLPLAERERRAQEGYAPELPGVEPAVVAFTAAVAAWAVSTFLERLIGYMPEGVRGSETLLMFHHGKVRPVPVSTRTECRCQDPSTWGLGDKEPFLGQMWPEPPSALAGGANA